MQSRSSWKSVVFALGCWSSLFWISVHAEEPEGPESHAAESLSQEARGQEPSSLEPRSQEAQAQEDWFERDVRPILAEHCLSCHNGETQESELRLDSRAGWLAGGSRGAAIDLEQPQQSLALLAISYRDGQLQMPPDGRLSDAQQATLRQWVAQGAPWPTLSPARITSATVTPDHSAESVAARHWAFQPVRSSALASGSSHHPIDALIRARLSQQQLTPAPLADPATWVRRAVLDLWGLPPTADQIDEFLSDTRPDRWERLIDELLADPSYGERWGRHWLDVARYADTKGYVDGGQARYAFAYTYRDYVIRAFNEDLSFGDMVRDQLAADLVEYCPEDRWRLAGLGFLTTGRRFNFNLHDMRDDQIDVVTRGLLGLTASCARCHDHKYDPISTADYYSLYGIFANTVEPPHDELPVLENPATSDEYRKYEAQLAEKRRAYDEHLRQVTSKIQHEMRAFASDYLVYLVQELPEHRVTAQNPLKTERTILRGPSAYGRGAIVRWRDYIRGRAPSDPLFGLWLQLIRVEPAQFSTRLQQILASTQPVDPWLREKLQSTPPDSMLSLAKIYGSLLELVDSEWQAWHAEHPEATALPDPVRETWRQVLYGPEAPMVMTAEEFIECYTLNEHVSVRNHLGEVEKVSNEFAQAAGRAMIVRDLPEPYQPFVFVRGEPQRLGRSVARQVPQLLAAYRPAEAHATSNRLQLAETILHPDNPLTARVIVNRVWYWHFGQPLVATPNDLGVRSAAPEQLELLDFLAHWFRQEGGSFKKLHRLIMTSETYRQSSLVRHDCMAQDPGNAYWWRYPPHRLEWEVIRDSLLFVSGQLDRTRGGRPLEMAPEDPQATRRTLYLFLDRQQVPAAAQTFDFPAPDFTAGVRPSTQVPQQQLFFLNSPFVLAQADALATRTLSLPSPNEIPRLEQLFRWVWARKPREAELELAQQFLRDLTDAEEHDRWSSLAHALLQANHLVWVD